MSQAIATARVLIVDDNPNALKALDYILEREGFSVDCAASAAVALEMLKKSSYDAMVSDLKMPGMDGIELLRAVRGRYPQLPFLVVTAHASVENAVAAVRDGATDYLQKPYQAAAIVDRLRVALERPERVAGSDPAPPEAAGPAEPAPPSLVGGSSAMQRVLAQLRTIAAKDIAVVIYGESGTGKELAARALHDGSARRGRPFVTVNCAAIPETLLENELFGHVKGAYTGANATHKGLFEEAHTGTIFLDEIGDIPASIQAKLLRVLQEQEFKKIGGTRDVRVDVRVIAATNRDLREAVATGRFREDLYYRINVVPIEMPSLRARAEDVPLLANHFREQVNRELGLAIRGFTDPALGCMMQYAWPGNVRELKNRIKMGMVMCRGTVVDASDLGFEEQAGRPAFPSFRDAKETFERDYVVKALKLSGGNVKKAAQLAGRDRSTFYDLLKKHEISADTFRDAP